MREHRLEQRGFLPRRRVSRLRVLAHLLQPALDVVAIGDDHLQLQGLEIARGIGVLREPVDDGQQRVGLPEPAGNVDLRRGHVDDADRRRRDLARPDELREATDPIVRE